MTHPTLEQIDAAIATTISLMSLPRNYQQDRDETILIALRFLRVIMQEPTNGMADSLRDEYSKYRGAMHIDFAKQLIKAVRDEALRIAGEK